MFNQFIWQFSTYQSLINKSYSVKRAVQVSVLMLYSRGVDKDWCSRPLYVLFLALCVTWLNQKPKRQQPKVWYVYMSHKSSIHICLANNQSP